MLTLELLDRHIAECRIYVEAGKEDKSTLDFLITLREDLSNANESDWAAYNKLVKHLPNEDADPVLIILKGQLLVEQLIRRFIDTRLPNSKALDNQQFTAAQYIAIAESMCLGNEEPKWLWQQIKELNTIRNKLAHNLDHEKTLARINSFVSTVSNAQHLKNKSISNVISRLYGMLQGLCDVSCSECFRIDQNN